LSHSLKAKTQYENQHKILTNFSSNGHTDSTERAQLFAVDQTLTMFSITARCVSSSLWGTVFGTRYKSAELLVSLKLYGSGMCMRLGIFAQVLERNINLCGVETFHTSKQNCTCMSVQHINIHPATKYAASSNTVFFD
jgi:hypothetical protein